MDFLKKFSSTSSKDEKILPLAYQSNDKVLITNFPDDKVSFYNPKESQLSFKITENRLEPISIPEELVFKNIAKISFNSNTKELIVTSTGTKKSTQLKNTVYYLFKLRQSSNPYNIKLHSVIKADETADNFATYLNNKPFNFGDIIEVECYAPNEIAINNFPIVGQSEDITQKLFNSETIKGFFKITTLGLQRYNPTDILPTTTLPNTIKINKIDNTSLINLNFNTIDKSIQVFSFGGNGDTSSSYNYCIFKLYNSQNTLITTGTLLSDGSISDFSNNIKLKNFDDNYILDLTYDEKSKSHIIITNLQGIDHTPTEVRERYRVLSTGLEFIPVFLQNVININSINNTSVALIKFNSIDKKFTVKALGNVADSTSTYDYMVFNLYNEADTTLTNAIKTVKLPSNTDGTDFSLALNDYEFDYGQIIKLTYASMSMTHVEITNFPSKGTNHTPKSSPEYFKITSSGLLTYMPPSNILPTRFIFNSTDNKEMLKVKFDKATKRLAVTSTGASYNGLASDNVFIFQLKSGVNIKTSATIKGNESADNFKNILNDEIFEFGDTIVLTYLDKRKIALENYPNTGNTYNMSADSTQSFTITQNGIVPILTSNKITVRSKNDEEVVTIEFIKETEEFIVSSTGIIPDVASTEPYLSFTLKDKDGNTILNTVLNSNANGDTFKTAVNTKKFKFAESTLILTYKDKSKIEISNYPSYGQTYVPKINANAFQIFPDSLLDSLMDNKIKIINDNSEEIASLYFIKKIIMPNVVVIATSTDSTSTDVFESSEKYVQFVKYDSNGLSGNGYAEILGKQTAKTFSTTLNHSTIKTNLPVDIFRMSNKISNRIIINDYKGQSQYEVREEPEFLMARDTNLIPHELNYNKIKFKNRNNTAILYIYFDKVDINNSNTIYIEPYSTGILNRDSDNFYFKILDSTGTNMKIEGRINRNENGDSIKISGVNSNISKNFAIGDILEIGCANLDLVEIFDFPFTATPKVLAENPQKFTLTSTGLVLIPGKYVDSQEIDFSNIAKINFNSKTKQLMVASTGNIMTPNLKNTVYFLFKLRDTSNNIKFSSYIKADETGDSFVADLNNKPFEFGDIIEVTSFTSDLIEIKNFPSKGQNKLIDENLFNMDTYQGFFKITKEELQEFKPSAMLPTTTLPNTMNIKKVNNTPLISLNFNINDKVMQTFSFNGNADNSSRYSYLIFKLYNSQNTLITTSTLTSNMNTSPFTDELNLKIFDYKYYIDLTYDDKSKSHIEITDFPSSGINHIPTDTRERYKITPKGLEAVPIFLSNVININSVNDTPVISIKFNIIDKKFNVKALGNIADSSSAYDYVVFNLYNSKDTTFSNAIKTIKLTSNSDPTTFSTNLNEISFDYNQIITLTYDNRALAHLEITNFPSDGVNHIPKDITEYFKITSKGLKYLPKILSNVININSINNAPVTSIKFNITNKKLNVISLINIADRSSKYNYVIFTLYDDITLSNTIETAELISDINPVIFSTTLNDVDFDYNQIIKLVYDYKAIPHIEITDFPSKGRNHIPTDVIEYYEITPNGLNILSVFLKNTINIKGVNNSPVASVKFNFLTNKITVITANNIADSTSVYDYVTFTLYSSTDTTFSNPIKVARLISDSNSSIFSTIFNDTTFNYNEIIKLTYDNKALSHMEIINFPSDGMNYTPNEIIEYYKITPTGLEAFPVFLKNIIDINSINNTPVNSIKFNFISKSLTVTASNNIADNRSTYDYITFSLYDLTDTTLSNPIKTAKLISNSNAVIFLTDLNGDNFDYNQIIRLTYDTKAMIHVKISNFPSDGTNHTPRDIIEHYKITPNGLENFPVFLKNTININSVNDDLVVSIKFNTKSRRLNVISTNNIADNTRSYEYITIKLYSSADVGLYNPAKTVTLTSSIVATIFSSDLDNINFAYGQFIQLNYSNSSMSHIKITNFPTDKMDHTPQEIIEYYKITSSGLESYKPPIKLLPNNFVFNSSKNIKMAEVKFDNFVKRLVVSSTGVYYDGQDNVNAFIFDLKSSSIVENFGIIKDVGNAEVFKKDLDDRSFDYGYTINVSYLDKTKVILENYPIVGKNYKMVRDSSQQFVITQSGITPLLIQNKITINSKNHKEVLTIEFVKDAQEFIVIYSGEIPDPSSTETYFTLILKNQNANTLIKVELKSNEDGRNFKNALHGKRFELTSNFLVLIYKDKTKIQISNYPSIGQTYTPQFNADIFQILDSGLLDWAFNSSIKIINDNNDEMCELRFMKLMNLAFIIATFTDAISTNEFGNEKKYIQYLQYSKDSMKLYDEILGKQNAASFCNNLNEEFISFENPFDIIRIANKITSKILISNYTGQKQYKVGEEPEFLRLTTTEVTKHELNYNKIRFKNTDNSSILFIYFDKLEKDIIYVQPYSTGIINKDSDNWYFKILDPTEKTTKIQGQINKNQSGDSIQISADNSNISKDFNIGDILEIGCSQSSLVEIFDFQTKGTIKTLDGNSQKFLIYENGLEDYLSKYLANTIIINNLSDTPTVYIKFNIKSKVYELNTIDNTEIQSDVTPYNYVTVKLYHLVDNTLYYPISNATLKSNEKPGFFRFILHNTIFSLDNILEITCADSALNKVEITNFETEGSTHRVVNNKEYFRISKKGLISFTPTSVLEENIITIRSFNNFYKDALTIKFDPVSKTIKATATNDPIGKSSSWSSTTAFVFTLKDQNGNVVKYEYVYGRDIRWTASTRDGLAVDLANKVNNTPFDYGYSLELYAPARKYRYISKTILFISNLPFKSNIYSPFNDTETLTITPLGLVLQSNSPLGNATLLKDIIILKNIHGRIMVQIYFDNKSKKLLVSSSSINSVFNTSDEYFVFKLKDKTGKENISRIIGDVKGDNFADSLNNKISFDFGDIITLSCADLSKISIENYNDYGKTYTPLKNNERFIITETGLLSITFLKNAITFLGIGNRLIAKIYFDVDDKKLIVTSSGTISHSGFGDREYFKVILKDSSDNIIKEASVKGNENANNFVSILNNLDFQYDYTITVNFAEKNRFLVSNYPTDGDTYKSSDNNPKTFTITKNGLILLP